MRVRVLYHDHCFDGTASAALFSQFYADKIAPTAEFAYAGMAHTADQQFADSLFDGDENAIVDFKYAPHPKLTWWFDHHQSAFLSPADADHFRRERHGNYYFDPAYTSCTKFIAHIARDRFGYENPFLADLVQWADIIDSAQYASAQQAVELAAPAMKLTLLIEAANGSAIIHRIIGWMRRHTLDEIVAMPEIQALFQPLYERHVASIDLIRQRSTTEGGVIFFDLVGTGMEGYNKFIPYYLFPDNVYTVSVSEQPFRTKVSVGSSPWQANASATTSPPSANATAAAATPRSAPSASLPGPSKRPGRRPAKSSPNCSASAAASGTSGLRWHPSAPRRVALPELAFAAEPGVKIATLPRPHPESTCAAAPPCPARSAAPRLTALSAGAPAG
jgi:hypothetical protein